MAGKDAAAAHLLLHPQHLPDAGEVAFAPSRRQGLCTLQVEQAGTGLLDRLRVAVGAQRHAVTAAGQLAQHIIDQHGLCIRLLAARATHRPGADRQCGGHARGDALAQRSPQCRKGAGIAQP